MITWEPLRLCRCSYLHYILQILENKFLGLFGDVYLEIVWGQPNLRLRARRSSVFMENFRCTKNSFQRCVQFHSKYENFPNSLALVAWSGRGWGANSHNVRFSLKTLDFIKGSKGLRGQHIQLEPIIYGALFFFLIHNTNKSHKPFESLICILSR